MVEIAPLVLVALAPDELGVEVDPIGPLELAWSAIRCGQTRNALSSVGEKTRRSAL